MARRRGKGKGRDKGRSSAAPKVVHPDASGVDIGAREVCEGLASKLLPHRLDFGVLDEFRGRKSKTGA